MKIIETTSKQVYEISPRGDGENRMLCPVCSSDRKKENQKKKPFSFNPTSGAGNCLNCGSKFVEYKPYTQEKKYFVPDWENKTDLTDVAVNYWNGRGISQETLIAMRVYSDTHYFVQLGKECECMCFPYFRGGNLVNIKFRGPKKSFELVKGAELILWNIDIISESSEIIICEGESDLLSIYECGFKNVISVPNGAKNTAYLDSCIDLFESVKKITIVHDNDMAGVDLRDNLIRRFGEERCFIVNLDTCNDANEYLIKNGGFELHNRINEADPIPVSGVFDANSRYKDAYNMYINGMPPGNSTGIPELDGKISIELGRLMVVTGIPSHGKSEFVDDMLSRTNILHGWKVGYFSPENHPIEYHTTKLVSKISGKSCKPDYLSQDEFENTYSHINDNFFWIYPEDGFSVEVIIEKAKQLVKMHGINVMVLDPYNKFEHKLRHGENKTDFVSRFLDMLIDFGKKNNVLVILIAHPTKMKKNSDGTSYEIPTLYDISDSANFYNKCDYGVCVYRNFADNTTNIIIQKIKFKHWGEGGNVELSYNYRNGRYESLGDINTWSSGNYLTDGIDTSSNTIERQVVNYDEPQNCPF